jgi:hypothetical protein
MAAPKEKLAESLEVPKTLQQGGARLLRSGWNC